jgi:hypothetical protein
MRSSQRNELPFGDCADEFSKAQVLLAEVNITEAQCNLLKTKLQQLVADFEQLAQMKQRIS